MAFKAFKIKITRAHLEFFEQSRIYFSPAPSWKRGWLKLGDHLVFKGPVSVEPYTCFRKPGEFFHMGSFSYSRSTFSNAQTPGSDQIVGRYCAIADQVEVMGWNHPMTRLSSGGFDYTMRAFYRDAVRDAGTQFKRVATKGRKTRPPLIEHDVWIGSRALLGRGITIGTGAVIAAGAIVTKDVAPYSIVAGNPAVHKKFRFPPELIERLLASRWWEYSFAHFGGMDTTRPERFLDAFEARVASGDLVPYTPEKIRLDIALKALSAPEAEAEAPEPAEEE